MNAVHVYWFVSYTPSRPNANAHSTVHNVRRLPPEERTNYVLDDNDRTSDWCGSMLQPQKHVAEITTLFKSDGVTLAIEALWQGQQCR